MAKRGLKTLQRKLTKLAAELIHIRDKDICQRCGKHATGSAMHVSHVVPKSRGNILRWDLQNLKLLCFYDHMHWWHKDPTESGEWFKTKFPARWAYLEQMRRGVVKWKEADYKEMIRKYQEMLNDL